MKITVIVPSYRRPKDLARCLAALKEQERSPDEVVVVMRDTDEETKRFLTLEPQPTLPIFIAVVKVPGVVAAMNMGLDKATGDIICFTDDDSQPYKDWLKKIENYFLKDERLGGIGGKDNVYKGSKKEEGVANIIGKITWFGKIIGNHHIGAGEPREVDILKGVNMSFRASAIKEIRFDTRLRGMGAQPHLEIPFCLAIKQKGWKLIYDPEILVNHYVAQRFDEDQRNQFNAVAFSNSVYNETLSLLNYLPLKQQIIFLIWANLVGTKKAFGLVQWFRYFPTEKTLATEKLIVSLRGRWQAFFKIP